jgi:hypothetical protein
LQTFFGGLVGQTRTALMTETSWTDDELDALNDRIDRVQQERKQI